jgi:hypothetical protein
LLLLRWLLWLLLRWLLCVRCLLSVCPCCLFYAVGAVMLPVEGLLGVQLILHM